MGSENKEEPSLATLLDEIRCVKAIVTETKDGLTGVCARMDRVEPEVVALRKEVAMLKAERERDQKYARRRNVIISGIPVVDSEDTDALVTELAQGLGVVLRPFDLIVSHRLPTDVGIPDIIAQFFTVRTKFVLVRRAKKHKLQMQGTPIYVSEHLTATTKGLLKAAKQLKKAKLIQFVWTSNGDLFVRKAEGEPAQRVDTLADLERFGWTSNTGAASTTAVKVTPAAMPKGTEKRNMDKRSPDNYQQHTTIFNKKLNLEGVQGGSRPRTNSTNGPPSGQSTLQNFGQFSKGSAMPMVGGALSQALSQNQKGA